MTTIRLRPFGSGSQYSDWTGCNCDRCEKGARLLGPDAWPTCEIEAALIESYVGDGKVDEAIAERMGHTDNADSYVWPCNEVVWTEEWKAEYQRRKAVGR